MTPTFTESRRADQRQRYEAVAVSTEGDLAAAVDELGSLHIFDLPASGSRSQARALKRQGAPSAGLCFVKHVRDEILLPVGKRICVIDARTLTLVKTLSGHKQSVLFVTASGSAVLSRDASDVVLCWDASDWSAKLSFQADVLAALGPSCSCSSLATAALLHSDGRISIWGVPSHSASAELALPLVDGRRLRPELLAVAAGVVAVFSREEASGVGLLTLWFLTGDGDAACLPGAWSKPTVLQVPVLCRQLLSWKNMLCLAHSDGVLVVEGRTGQIVRQLKLPDLSCIAVALCGRAVFLRAKDGLGFTELRPPKAKAFSSGKLMRVEATRIGDHTSDAPGPSGPSGPSTSVELQAMPEPQRSRKLKDFLHRNGFFPPSSRAVAWRLLLCLPRNEAAYEVLSGADASGSHGRDARLSTLLTALETWAPELAAVAWLRPVAQPLAAVFGRDSVLAFEACASLMLNWALPWLETFPAAPKDCLAPAVIALQADPELLSHLQIVSENEVERLIWPVLRSLLSDFLPKELFEGLWDHLIASWREPWMLPLCASALLRCKRREAMRASEKAELLQALRSPGLGLGELLQELHLQADRLRASSSLALFPRLSVPPLGGATGAAYPPLTLTGPNLIMDYLRAERLKARADAAGARAAEAQTAASKRRLSTLEAEALRQAASQEVRLKAEDTQIQLSQHLCALRARASRKELSSKSTERLQRLTALQRSTAEALRRQQLMQDSENAVSAQEQLSQKLLAEVQAEEALREGELLDLEAAAGEQLWQVLQVSSEAEASRSLRDSVRQRLSLQAADEAAELRLSWASVEKERAEAADRLQRKIEEERQYEREELQRQVQQELDLESMQRMVQLSRLGKVRAARDEARWQGEVVEAALARKEKALFEDAVFNEESSAKRLEELRAEQRRQLMEKQATWAQRREDGEEKLESEERQLHRAMLAQERERFNLQLHGAKVHGKAMDDETDDLLKELLDSTWRLSPAEPG